MLPKYTNTHKSHQIDAIPGKMEKVIARVFHLWLLQQSMECEQVRRMYCSNVCFYVRHLNFFLPSIQGQTCHGCIDHDILGGLCSELLLLH